ncbi:ROK family protein [Butyrivibrio proteoclasticus]|uniref:ROK family protein n=1 Tax=Butyrivibrio proteoclasticus TaxID=43305 RepID=UPI00047B8972|nr:ROK family protein [Butyrivibrio proteoclasticus]
MFRIGIDIGGTNIAAGIVDESYKIVKKKTIKTRNVSTPSEMIQAIAGLVKDLMKSAMVKADMVTAIGVGVPGTLDPESGKVLYANNLGFEDVPFLTELKKALGEELADKVYFDNDANAAAIGEYITGDYNAKNFVMMTIGTGIGGGVIINGRVLRGCNYAAAEFGHMTINFDGVDCNCGRKGCFEDYASAEGLMNLAWEASRSSSGKKSLLGKVSKREELDGEIFFEAVRKGDKVAKKVLDEYLFYLSEGIINIINIFQPDVLTLSGGITKAADLYLDKLKELVSKGIYSRNSSKNTEIMLSKGISDSGDIGIIGAALIYKM